MCSMENRVTNTGISLYGNKTYCGDPFALYRNIEPLRCTHESNTVLQVNYTSIQTKHVNKYVGSN